MTATRKPLTLDSATYAAYVGACLVARERLVALQAVKRIVATTPVREIRATAMLTAMGLARDVKEAKGLASELEAVLNAPHHA